MSVIDPILVCLCGGLGASVRYVCDSCGLLAGIIAGLYAHSAISDPAHVLLATGFLGGFSTFSTMMNESVGALRSGRIAVFAGYMALSVVVPVAAVALGYQCAA